MDCCEGSELIIRCGETFSLDLEYRDPDTDELLPMLPKARATIRLSPSSAALVTLTSDAGDITVNDPVDGQGTLTIASDVTPTLSSDNTRIEAWLAVEFYDDSGSPEIVEAFPPASIVIQPDYV